MERRNFMTGAAALAAYAKLAFSPLNVFADEGLRETGSRTAQFPDDMNIIEKRDDATSLIDVVCYGKTEIIPTPEIIDVNLPFNPDMVHSPLYIVKGTKGQRGNQCTLDAEIVSGGSSNLISKEGYFITAAHVAERMIEEGVFTLWYNPVADLVRPARILAKSDKYDLALGKVDLPDDFSFEWNPCISRGTVNYSDFVYTFFYDKDFTLSSRTLRSIINSFDVDKGCNPVLDNLRSFKNKKDQVMIWTGEMIKVIGPYAAKYDNDRFFTVEEFEQRETDKYGYSGSLTYGLNGDILGVLSGGQEFDGKIPKDAINLIKCTRPNHLRDFICKYIYGSTGIVPRVEVPSNPAL